MSKDGQSPEELAQQKEEESEKAKEEMRALEEGDLPDDIDGWPTGPAKYETFGLDDDAYGDGVTEKLGPANLQRHADGSVTIDGKKVDNPEDYRGDPIEGAEAVED